MKVPILPIMLIAALYLTGCSSVKVSSDHDSSYDFSKVLTYQWLEAPEEIRNEDDTYLNLDVQKGLNTELAKREWKQVLETADANVQVVYYIKLKEHEEYAEPINGPDHELAGGLVYSREKGSWSYEERNPDLYVYTVEIGTLTVLLYDTETGDRIWRGTLQTKLDRSAPIEKQKERIRQFSQKLMDRIPSGH